MSEFIHSFTDNIGGPNCPSCHAARVLPAKSREKMRLYPERWEPDACLSLKTKCGSLTVCTHFMHCDRRVIGGPNEWYETIIFAERTAPGRPPFREWLDFRRGYATKAMAEFGHAQVERMIEPGVNAL